MRTFLDLGEEVIEVDLTTPWFAFDEHEQHRRQTWSEAAQLSAWLGLSSFLVALLVFSFFAATN